MWELLKLEKLKANQLAEDSGSIISRIIELDTKSKIEFEHVHAKTNKIEDSAIENIGLEMVLKCDKKVKEERIRCVR